MVRCFSAATTVRIESTKQTLAGPGPCECTGWIAGLSIHSRGQVTRSGPISLQSRLPVPPTTIGGIQKGILVQTRRSQVVTKDQFSRRIVFSTGLPKKSSLSESIQRIDSAWGRVAVTMSKSVPTTHGIFDYLAPAFGQDSVQRSNTSHGRMKGQNLK